MYIHISFVDQGLADQKRNSLQATGQSINSSMSALRLLMALLLILLAALLAVWVVGPEVRAIAGEAKTVVPNQSTVGEPVTPAADGAMSVADTAPADARAGSPRQQRTDSTPRRRSLLLPGQPIQRRAKPVHRLPQPVHQKRLQGVADR